MYTCLQKRARKSVSHYGEPINSNEITTTPKSVSSLIFTLPSCLHFNNSIYCRRIKKIEVRQLKMMKMLILMIMFGKLL